MIDLSLYLVASLGKNSITGNVEVNIDYLVISNMTFVGQIVYILHK